MNARSERFAAGAGILAAVLMMAGFVLIGIDAPGPDSTRTEILNTYNDDGTNAMQALGVLLTGLGGVAFLPFLSYVRNLLGRASGEESILPGAAYAGGVLLVAGVFAGAVLGSAASVGGYFDAYRVDPDVAMTTVATGFYFNGLGAMTGGVRIGAASIAARRTGLLPGWLAIAGLAVAVLSLPGSLLGMWILVEGLWIAIMAGILAARSARAAGVPASGPLAA
jgi:hypothetical protein